MITFFKYSFWGFPFIRVFLKLFIIHIVHIIFMISITSINFFLGISVILYISVGTCLLYFIFAFQTITLQFFFQLKFYLPFIIQELMLSLDYYKY